VKFYFSSLAPVVLPGASLAHLYVKILYLWAAKVVWHENKNKKRQKKRTSARRREAYLRKYLGNTSGNRKENPGNQQTVAAKPGIDRESGEKIRRNVSFMIYNEAFPKLQFLGKLPWINKSFIPGSIKA
jgi:hypothetical protein